MKGESPMASVESIVTFSTSRPMHVKHWSSFRNSARSASLTKVTTFGSMMTRSGEVQRALAGTHSPRNLASTSPPVIVCEVGNVTATQSEIAATLIVRLTRSLTGVNIVIGLLTRIAVTLCLKSRNHTWSGSVQGAVATWSNHGREEIIREIRILITDQVATAPCTDLIQERFGLLRQRLAVTPYS